MALKHGTFPELPLGCKFIPSDEELVTYYLMNKVYSKPLPADFMPHIHASQLYSMPPQDLVEDQPCTVDNVCYFFLDGDEYFRGEIKTEYLVGNGNGSWKSDGKEDSIYNSDEELIAFKIYFTYFPESNSEDRDKSIQEDQEMEWSFEKYRLPLKSDKELEGKEEEWVVGKIIRGDGYEP